LPLDALKKISLAEDNARQAILYAQKKAREAIESAELAGREGIASAVSRAETMITQLKRTADRKAAESAVDLASTTANRQAAIRVRAEGRLDKAAELIVERIVNI